MFAVFALPVIYALGSWGLTCLVASHEAKLEGLPQTEFVYRLGGSFLCLLGLSMTMALGAWVWTM